MKSEQVEQFLGMLGCSKIKRGNNSWINASCPLSPWKHAKGNDANPSFGISIEPEGASKYKCHGCGTSGELPYLVWMLAKYSKKNLSDLMVFLQRNNAPSEKELKERAQAAEYWTTERPKPIAGIRVNPQAMERKITIPELPILPESDLDKLRSMPIDVRSYLMGSERRLSAKTIEEWELGYHAGANRIAIPIRDCNKALVGISGRAFLEGQKPKYLHSSGFRGAFYLYGEDRARRGGRVVLVEGFFDVMILRQNGYNAVAMQGVNVSPFQIQKLKEFFSSVAILLDGDKAGYEGRNKCMQLINPALPASIVDMPEGMDPDQLDEALRIKLLGPPDLLTS